MKTKLLTLAIISIFTFVFGDVKTQQVTEGKSKIIVMFGNSITNQGKWEELLGRQDVLNWGIPGYATGQLIWTIKNVLHDHPGTKIWFLEGGINDITLGVPAKKIFSNYKIIVDSLKKNHIIPVVQSTILKVGAKEDNQEVAKLNKLVKNYCIKNNIDYIDLNAFLSKNGELMKELSIDGTHLKPDAYKPWTESVKKILSKYNL